MAKNWWFKFEWEDWLGDDDLSSCTLETQGFWIKCLCLMYRTESHELTGTLDQLRRRLGLMPEEITRCAMDLKNNGAANVRFGNGIVSIISRRLQRVLKDKENNRLYVDRHRKKAKCKDDVSPHILELRDKSQDEEEKRGEEPPPLSYIADDLAISETESAFDVKLDLATKKLVAQAVPPNLIDRWPAFIRGRAVGFTDKPKQTKLLRIGYALTDFQKDNKVSNGTNQPAANAANNKRSTVEKLGDYAEVFDAYPSESEITGIQ